MYMSGSDVLAKDYRVVDLDTMQEIKNVANADDEKGIYEVYELDAEGKVQVDPYTGLIMTSKKSGNIALVRK